MLGAIIGDIVGSTYEGNLFPVRKEKYRPFSTTHINFRYPAHPFGCWFTDDTAQTLAVFSALLADESFSAENEYGAACKDHHVLNPFRDSQTLIKSRVAEKLRQYYFRYPGIHARYGNSFRKWAKKGSMEENNSIGNGAAMRASVIGWLYDSLEEIIVAASLTAQVTHNSIAGMDGAEAVASAVFMARNGCTKNEIREYLSSKYSYDLEKEIAEIRKQNTGVLKIDVLAKTTVPNAVIAFLNSKNYTDTIKTAVCMGGDTDTVACMAGGIAEAFYNCHLSGESIPDEWKKKAYSVLRKRGV